MIKINMKTIEKIMISVYHFFNPQEAPKGFWIPYEYDEDSKYTPDERKNKLVFFLRIRPTANTLEYRFFNKIYSMELNDAYVFCQNFKTQSPVGSKKFLETLLKYLYTHEFEISRVRKKREKSNFNFDIPESTAITVIRFLILKIGFELTRVRRSWFIGYYRDAVEVHNRMYEAGYFNSESIEESMEYFSECYDIWGDFKVVKNQVLNRDNSLKVKMGKRRLYRPIDVYNYLHKKTAK